VLRAEIHTAFPKKGNKETDGWRRRAGETRGLARMTSALASEHSALPLGHVSATDLCDTRDRVFWTLSDGTQPLEYLKIPIDILRAIEVDLPGQAFDIYRVRSLAAEFKDYEVTF
jgi:hypothetical protein